VAKAVSGTEVQLSWEDKAANETGYILERRTTGQWIQVATLPANSTAHVDRGLQSGIAYEYRLKASGKGGDSDYSTVVRTPALTAKQPPVDPGEGLKKGPVLHFRFDQKTGAIVRDSSPSKADGKLDRGFRWRRTRGRFGGALEGSGRGRVTVPISGAISVGGDRDFSVSMWIKLVARNLDSSPLFVLGIKPAICQFVLAPQAKGLNAGIAGKFLHCRKEFQVGEWVHCALVRRGATATLYVKGVKVDSKSLDRKVGRAGGKMMIGRNVADGGPHALYDEFRLYDRALGDAEVAALAGVKDAGKTGAVESGGLRAEPLGTTRIKLSWSGKVPCKLYYDRDGTRVGVPYHTFTERKRAYVHAGLTRGKSYTYNVIFPDAPGRKATVTARTPLAGAPGWLSAEAASSEEVRVTWSGPIEKGAKYDLYWDKSGTGTGLKIGVISPKKTSFSHTGLQPDTAYLYRLFAPPGGPPGLLGVAAARTPPAAIPSPKTP
jgi:hypothetical protein